ncbi:hypothetical protein [Rappaport israeli]|uniref:hypothetical protein n=1 Tax=Rappaport israeli TaxID=1839807 RepID=UPI000A5E6129|nr:hypothetical protein [Rappaport israeli]
MATLISFLGVGNKQKGYRTANYQFNDGQIFNNTQYIGLTLVEKIKLQRLFFWVHQAVCGTYFWKMQAKQ